MLRCGLLAIALFLLAVAASAKEVTVHGFVTAVDTPTSFQIDDYKITRDPSLKPVLDNPKLDSSATPFKPEDIRIGTELEVGGDYTQSSGQLQAKSIKVFLLDTKIVNRVALLQKPPALKQSASGSWHGLLLADGQRVVVSDSTSIILVQSVSEKKPGKPAQDAHLTSLDTLNLNSFVHYEGTTQPDGSVLATTVEVAPAAIQSGETKLRQRWTPKIKDPDYAKFKPGQLKMFGKKFKVLPDADVQSYISKLGNSLVPERQQNLPQDSPLKIPFAFYVVNADQLDAHGYASGAVLVNSGLFSAIDNEAQLAYIIAHEISHTLERQWWRDLQYHKGTVTALDVGGMAGGLVLPGSIFLAGAVENSILNDDPYARALENQADREALTYMLDAGYDVREAPQSWKALSLLKDRQQQPLFSSTHEMRRSYLAAELNLNYPALDYSTLKKDSNDFHIIARKVREAEQGNRDANAPAAK